MLVAGGTRNIFLLTGISNMNIFIIKKKNNVVVNTKIYDKVASKIQNYKVNYTNKFIKNQHNIFPFVRVEDVWFLPGAGQNNPLPILLPPDVQIEADLLSGGPCLTWKSGKNSSCVEACHTQAYCVC